MDITMIITTFIRLCCAIIVVIVIPWIQEKKKNEKVANAIQVSEEIAKIAQTVVSAANEYDITGELIKLGKTKAEYALETAKKECATKGIVYVEDLLIKEIKAAVTLLRTNITGTDAQKITK